VLSEKVNDLSSASFPKTLDRYILTQLLDYCLLGVVIFSLVAFFSNSFLNFIQDVQRYGISIQTALLMMGLQLPETVAMIMPVALFFAVLLVYNTLNNQFEIIASAHERH
jgi:lipopolysaccharide export LptBFGC system permease protein LptF